MSFAFMPLYTGDYRRDTAHLTPAKHGIYLLLLMHCWDSKGPAPLDEQECAGVVNARSADEIDALRYVLNRYFVRMEDGWYNKRMQHEIERSENISSARSDAGRKGYQAKAKQLLSKSQASASTPTPTLTPIPTPTPKPQKLKTLASRDEESRSAGGVVITITSNLGEEIPIHQSFVDELEKAYPDVDVPATLRECRAWCIANPKRRKTSGGIHRFLNSWFAKVQNA